MTECILSISTIKHLNSEWDSRETSSFCWSYENTSYRRGHIDALRACPFSLLFCGFFKKKKKEHWRIYLKHRSYWKVLGNLPNKTAFETWGLVPTTLRLFSWRSLLKSFCGNKHWYQSIFYISSLFHVRTLILFLCNLTAIKATPDKRIKSNQM